MAVNKAKDIFEKALTSIYNEGYNEAIENVCDYLYSFKAPSLSPEQQADLNIAFSRLKRKCKTTD